FQHARPELAAIVETRNALQEIIRVVGHITRTSHTISEIERALDIAKMLVVVPQPRHQKAAMCVNDLSVRRWFDLSVGCHAHDSISTDMDAGPCCNTKIARIEQARVADHKIRFRSVREFMRETSRPCVVSYLLS